MTANFIQKGDTLDHIAAGTLSVGDVIEVNEQVGVVGLDAVSGETVAVHVEGVFELPKKGTETPAFGERLFWDGTGMTLTATANAYAGICARPATSGNATVWVKLGSGPIAGGV